MLFKPNLETRLDGADDQVPHFIVAVTSLLNRWGRYFEDDAQRVEYVASRLNGLAAEWYVGLHETMAPELRSVRAFVLILRVQFEDPMVLNST